MSVLVGGVAGSSSRLSGGLSSSALSVSDVVPTVLQYIPPSIDQRIGPNIGRFYRHLNGCTVDALGLAISGVTVNAFDSQTEGLIGSMVSDASGAYDFAIYREGTTYYIYANKAGSPEIFGTTSDQLVPV